MIKEQLSQLVQDVIDGEESAAKALDILLDIRVHVQKCLCEVQKVRIAELDGSD